MWDWIASTFCSPPQALHSGWHGLRQKQTSQPWDQDLSSCSMPHALWGQKDGGQVWFCLCYGLSKGLCFTQYSWEEVIQPNSKSPKTSCTFMGAHIKDDGKGENTYPHEQPAGKLIFCTFEVINRLKSIIEFQSELPTSWYAISRTRLCTLQRLNASICVM